MSTIRSGDGDNDSDREDCRRDSRYGCFHSPSLFDYPSDVFSLAAAAAANQVISTNNGLAAPDGTLDNPGLLLPTQFDESGAFFNEAGFSEVFDSLNWVFEGIPDSSFVAPVVL